MRKISTRLLTAVFEILEQRGIRVERLLDNTSIELEEVESGAGHIDWPFVLTIINDVTHEIGGVGAIRELGQNLIYTQAFAHPRRLLSELSDPWQLFRVIRLWLAAVLIPAIPRNFHETDDGQIILSFLPLFEIDDGEAWFELLMGALETFPNIIHYPNATVSFQKDGDTATFLIKPPPIDAAYQRSQEASATGAVARSAFYELIRQQLESQAARNDLETTIEWYDHRYRQLLLLPQLGQKLVDAENLGELARIVLTLMLMQLNFIGGTLTITTENREERRWGAGHYNGPSDVSYPFSHGSRFNGLIELWGSPPYDIGGSDDPVARFIPWLVIAIMNTFAESLYDDERQWSAAQIATLEAARGQFQTREKEYDTLIEDSSDGILICDMQTGFILRTNRAFRRMMDYDIHHIQRLTITDLLDPKELQEDPLQKREILTGKTVHGTRTALTRTGAQVVLQTTASLLDNSRVQIIARDITKWKNAEERLRESEERFALAVQGANDGLWDWNLKSGHFYFSPRGKQILGYDDRELGTSPDEWFSRIHPDDRDKVRSALRDHLVGSASSFSIEHRVQHKSGAWVWILARGLAVRNAQNLAYRIAGSFTDTTERKNFEERLYYSAYHDSLTQLPNREWVMQWLRRELQETAKSNFALFYFDLDRFKIVNDSLGHMIGDEILKRIGHRLQKEIHQTAHAARIGGDEFVLIVDAFASVEELNSLALSIIRTVSRPIQVAGQEVILGCSVGITTREQNQYTLPEDVLRDADLAMYKAKAAGGDRYVHYEKQFHKSAIESMQLEMQLRKAIENNALAVAYQPIVDAKSGLITSVEVLTRWTLEDGTSVSPSVFIPVAEESGLIHPMGKWVARTAIRQVLAWRRILPTLTLSVNLSPVQLVYPTLIERIRELIEEFDIPRDMLIIEITENALISQQEIAIAQLQRIQQTGTQVHIDDFGTGYSSLSYLARLPFDGIKIDRTFIDGVEDDTIKQKIVQSILQLSLSLNKTVIVEGIETKAAENVILNVSKDLYLQGNVYSSAVSATQIEQMLQSKQSLFL